MKLSEVVNETGLSEEVKIYEDREFDGFAPVHSHFEGRVCTYIAHERYLQKMDEKVRMVITNEELAPSAADQGVGVCVVKNPREFFFKLHNILWKEDRENRETFIGDNCRISPLAVVENGVILGDRVVVEEFAVIRCGSIIGKDSIIRAGAKIGNPDFEFKMIDSVLTHIKHVGGVILGERVEVQCDSCINRALYPWDNTVIGDDTKIDNAVHIAHGVKIGRRCMVTAHASIGGRTEIGDDCWIGLAAVVSNALRIGERARVNIGSVVTRSVGSDESVSGNFAISHDVFLDYIKKLSKKEE